VHVLARLASIALMLSGCAWSVTSSELVLARTLYRRALEDGAAALAPREMYQAALVLDAAEREHAITPGDPSEAELAYLARRKIIAAMRVAELRADAAQTGCPPTTAPGATR
jgi:hypothetical protein